MVECQGPVEPPQHLYRLLPSSTAILSPMRPVSLTYTGTVGVTIQEVFDLISDPSRMASGYPTASPSSRDRRTRAGATGTGCTSSARGRKADAVIEVIEYEPPTTFAWSRSSTAAARRPSSSSSSRAAPPGSR